MSWCSRGVVRFLPEILHFHGVMVEDIAEQGLGQWWPYRAVRRAIGLPLESVLGDNGRCFCGASYESDGCHPHFIRRSLSRESQSISASRVFTRRLQLKCGGVHFRRDAIWSSRLKNVAWLFFKFRIGSLHECHYHYHHYHQNCQDSSSCHHRSTTFY